MIEKPKQYFDTRSHQLYYQWDESEYFSHQEPIYDRTREYVEALETENAELREKRDNLFKAVIAKNNEALDLLCENEKLRELLLDYDKMLAIAADELADHQSSGLSMDSVLNALRIRMYDLRVEVDA